MHSQQPLDLEKLGRMMLALLALVMLAQLQVLKSLVLNC